MAARFVLVGLLAELVIVGLLARNWFGGRTSPERFADAYGVTIDEGSRPAVAATLHRTYRGRVFGALAGAVALGGAGLLIGTGAAVFGAFVGLVAGAMAGSALAQLRPRPSRGAIRQASLDARTVRDYAPPRAVASMVFASIACLAVTGLGIAAAPAGLGPYAPAMGLAVAVLVIVPISRVLQRRIVEAARGEVDQAVDDALRHAAVRAVHHSTLGVLLCGIVVGALGGLLVQSTLAVNVGTRTLFVAPPGSTSISIDTGVRQVTTPNSGPVRVYWIEADGSEHTQLFAHVVGVPNYGSRNTSGASGLFGLAMLAGGVGVFLEWGRATSAWRRRGSSPPPFVHPDPAGAAP